MICISTVALVLIWQEKWLQNVYLLKTPSLEQIMKQRMHSSRMLTARSSSCQWGVCLSACWDTPGCGPGDPPGQTPEAPPGCGPGDLQGMLGYHPLETCKACWDTTPPWTEFLKHTSENITLPQLRCGR